SEGCHLPSHWEGNWFQSGVHQTITITRNTINTKGRCVEADGEKYLVYNERDDCYRCVVFHEKHYNVLQYKETFCLTERRPVRSVCSTITGDANLFAMFRLDAKSIDCPFRAPLSFTYNRGHGECRYPVSSVDSCTHPSRLLLNYQACPDVPGTESTVEELQCLASWKEGSSRYLLGLIKYQHHASFEERFRCFVYEKIKKGLPVVGSVIGGERSGVGGNRGLHHASAQQHHQAMLMQPMQQLQQHQIINHNMRSIHLSFNSSASALHSSSSYPLVGLPAASSLMMDPNVMFRVSQSGDATCNGLSILEGSRTMTFRRVQAPKPCHFPSWLQIHPQWHTLDLRSTFSFDSSNLKVTNSSSPSPSFGDFFGSVGSEPVSPSSNILTMTASCSQILESSASDRVRLILHTTSGCHSGYMCTEIIRRDSHIIEIQMGSRTRRAEDACHLSSFNQSLLPYITLVSPTPSRKKCPSMGRFGVTGLSREGRLVSDACSEGFTSITVGCRRHDTLQLRSECAAKDVVAEYSCHGWWEEHGVSYLITTPLSRQSGASRYCFIFREVPSLSSLESKSRAAPGGERPIHQKLKLSRGYLEEEEVDMAEDGDTDLGRVLQFSSIADSCRRGVAPGVEGFLAFNVSSNGRCGDVSRAANPKQHHQYHRVLALIFLQVGGMVLIRFQ
ncbi:hypothetical protein Ocin01_13236, partial [Orchesella cincta]